MLLFPENGLAIYLNRLQYRADEGLRGASGDHEDPGPIRSLWELTLPVPWCWLFGPHLPSRDPGIDYSNGLRGSPFRFPACRFECSKPG
jgi:hypothetical protein